MDSSRWSAYKPRSGDIIIGTAPKVGTHWTLQIVSLLVFQSPEPRDLGFAPWLDAQFLAPLDEVLKKIESQAHRRILFSHLPFDALPIYDDVQYIHVARDGRDVCMSMLNHVSNMTTEHFDRFAENRLDGDTIQLALEGIAQGATRVFSSLDRGGHQPRYRSCRLVLRNRALLLVGASSTQSVAGALQRFEDQPVR